MIFCVFKFTVLDSIVYLHCHLVTKKVKTFRLNSV